MYLRCCGIIHAKIKVFIFNPFIESNDDLRWLRKCICF